MPASRRTPAPPPDLPGFTYERLLGSGGFSDVYLYEQHLPRRKVAVKVLLGGDDLNDTSRQAFIGEANVMAQMSSHPYIVTIFHADVAQDGRPFFVMEYAPGRTLSERYKSEWIPVEEVLRTGVRIASAVATAHSVGVLHRDIKPANILTNDFGWPALTDFGISSAVDDELADAAEATDGGTAPSPGMGMSVPWSPPEMFDDDPQPSVRSEVFSLGATVYTIVAGQTPFEVRGRKNGTIDLIGRIERGEITPIARPDVPPALVEVLRRAMSLRPAARYATAIDFARALQRVEMELGFLPTAIDVPNLHVPMPTRSTGGDDDETSVRHLQVVDAQPIATVTPDPRPGADERTATRNIIRVQAPPTTSVPVVGAPPAPALGPAPAHSGAAGGPPQAPSAPSSPAAAAGPSGGSAGPGSPDDAHDAPRTRTDEPADPADRAADAVRRRNRLVLVIGGVVAAVILVAALIGVFVVPREEAAGPTPTSEYIGPGAAPPSPRDGTVTLAENGDLTFTWTNPQPVENDQYYWHLTGQPGTMTTEEYAVVPSYAPGTTVCISVEIRRNGRASAEPLEICYAG